VDPKSLRLLDGSALDYDTGLLSKGFIVNNPHVSSSCGCGTSFSVQKPIAENERNAGAGERS
jgi:iron-sulfur cluster assembly accessory protein